MLPFIILSESITEIPTVLAQGSEAAAAETPVDMTELYEILAGLPDQIMAVLLAYLCFKTFLEMVK